MEDRTMMYVKPGLDRFCGWDVEFAQGITDIPTPEGCTGGNAEILP